MLSGVAIFARPESPLWDLIQPEAAVVRVPAISSLCRDDGWELRLSIGRDMAQSVDVALQVRFERDGRFGEYPQGTAALRRPSKFFASTGLWSAVSEAGDERHSLEMRLECSGLGRDGEEWIPPGPLFLTASLEADERATRLAAPRCGMARVPTTLHGTCSSLPQSTECSYTRLAALGGGGEATVIRFDEGRVTAKEYGALGRWTGLSELRVVGSLEARPLQPSQT